MVEQWSPKPKVKGSNPFSPDLTTRIQSPFGLGRAVCPLSPQRWFGRNCLVRSKKDGVHFVSLGRQNQYGLARMERLHSERPSHVLAVSKALFFSLPQKSRALVTKAPLSTKVLGVCARTQGRASSVHAVLGLTQTLAFSDGGLQKKVRC